MAPGAAMYGDSGKTSGNTLVARFQSKKPGQKKVPGKAGQRYWKNVGLGFKTPKEAIEGWNASAEIQQ
ncbi:TPA: 30S ribosomal protein S11, chloroplastic [Trebouxia sp. C0005]